MKAKGRLAALFGRTGISSRSRSSRAIAVPGVASNVYGNCAFSRLRKPALSLYAAALSALCAFALFASSAAADGRIGGANTAPASYLSGGLEFVSGLAVSKKENGDVYVVAGARSQRVDQFEPDGTFVRAFGWGVVPGTVTGTGTVTAGSNSIANVVTTLGAFPTGTYEGAGKIITGAGIPPNTQITGVTPTEIKLSKSAVASGTGVALAVAAGPGNIPTNERQRLTVNATGGEFSLSFRSPNPGSTITTTINIPFNAPASGPGSLQEALEGLSGVGPGNVSVSGGPGDAEGTTPYVIGFQGRFADTDVRQLTATDLGLSGGNPASGASVTTTTQGAGVLETCTTLCLGESFEEGGEGAQGSNPGQLRYSDACGFAKEGET